MLFELTRYATTRCPRWARRMGYLGEAIAIEARYKRCRAAWAPHLQASQAFILEAAEQCRDRRTALIAGSGLCLDLPLEQLATSFERVVLLDAVHPRAARKHGLANVQHVSLDVTGLADHLHKQNRVPDPLPQPDYYHIFPDVDFVVSLNLASQLPLKPLEWQLRHAVPEGARDALARGIIEAHLRWLAGFDAVRCLLVDRRWDLKDAQGRAVEQSDPLYGIQMPSPDRIWTWSVAPPGELSGPCWRENLIAGYFDYGDYAPQ